MLRIKLVRYGKKNAPAWRIVVVEKTKTGKGNVADYIGHYNPLSSPKLMVLDAEKYEKWIKFGAQPTDSVLRLKGKLVDKTKDYQKKVKTKVYKSKKEKIDEQENKKPEKPVSDDMVATDGLTEDSKSQEAVVEKIEETEEKEVEKAKEESKEETKKEATPAKEEAEIKG
ncbi:30S ribosomal protein S16 [Candidatus Microgenomates bacterium]|nr:30S ribosomal protein S16 [Candidatus Microgenomates bacterium]